MSETLETFEHAGCRVKIMQDTDDGGNPRDADNLGVMFTPHRRYVLGDASFAGTTPEYGEAERAFEHFTEYRNRGGIAAFERWLRVFLGATVVLKVGMIDHSGLSMYVGGGAHLFDPGGWDSGTVGVIFDTASTRERWGAEGDPAEIEAVLRDEIKAYDAFLRGSVVGYVVERPETWTNAHGDTRTDWETVGSCWGFLIVDHEADLDYVRDEARAEAEAAGVVSA